MFRKLIVVIVITFGLIWGSIIYVPIISASTVANFITAFNTGLSAGSNTSIAVKEYVLDPIARIVARQLLNNAISGIINKIQTGGRGGGPAFVQNWRNFQTEAQYRGEDVFRSILASTPLCNYASSDIKGVFGANRVIPSTGQNLRVNNFDPFTLRAACTMPANFNLTNYQNDFSGNGGWNAWSRMLEPQNNYYGLLFGSLDEAARQRNLEQSGDVYEATAGSGYTSIRDGCQDQLARTGVTGPSQPSQARCTFMGQVFTPGDLLGKSAAATIDQDLGWLTSSDEISEVIIAIGTALINRMVNLATSNPSNDYNSAPKADTSKSDGYLACINSCPAADNLTCQTNCASAWGYNVPQPSSTPPAPTSGGGGGGLCSDQGGSPNYAGILQTAQATVVTNNQGGIADLSTTEPSNGRTFLNFVAQEIEATTGLSATTNVLNGNGNLNPSGDLIGIWGSGDSTLERYDALIGDRIIRDAIWQNFTGDIPLNCAP